MDDYVEGEQTIASISSIFDLPTWIHAVLFNMVVVLYSVLVQFNLTYFHMSSYQTDGKIFPILLSQTLLNKKCITCKNISTSSNRNVPLLL